MAVAHPPVDGQPARAQQPAWHLPQPTEPEPQLVVYNSLTRSKVPFVPMRGRHVTWYNCGPTVYDASHMGHARNYVSQDIMRRVLKHLGYSIHFVMNITDIDDKIILRARQNHLVEQLRAQNPHLTPALLQQVRKAWADFFVKTIKKYAPDAPDVSGSNAPNEAAWEEISRLNKDEKWRTETTSKEPKFGMWFTALDKSQQAIIAAAMTTAVSSSTSELPPSSELIDASVDILASSLDAAQGHSVTDPSIFRALAAQWENAYFDDMRRMGVLAPDQLTRVSEYVPEIVTFTQKIISNGFGYADDKGNVWFDTKAFDGAKLSEEEKHSYARLAPWSKGNRELLDEGEGSLSTSTATTSGKRSSSDFALWKSSKPGEPSWESPWGSGRPGWHIECSVMATEVLGSKLDIHSGGVDLMFPHHDNELAQSEAHHGCAPWVNYFLHTGHLHIEGLKMSKSLKNFISIDEALQRYSSRQLRLAFLMLQTWSNRMDFRESAMQEVRNAEDKLNNFFNTVKAHMRTHAARGPGFSDGQHHYGKHEKALIESLTDAQVDFRKALCDSFDTPTAMSVLLSLVTRVNVYEKEAGRAGVNAGVLEAVARWVSEMLRMFGLGQGAVRETDIGWGNSDATGQSAGGDGATEDREAILLPYLDTLSSFRSAVRSHALASKPPQVELLKLADRLRDQDLVDLGVALEDNEDGKTAMLKLVPAEQLRAARDEKTRVAAEKAARKEETKRRQEAERLEKLRKSSVPPALLFKPKSQGGLAEEDEWKAWDEESGLPTVDGKTGEEISKKRRKACEKELATHSKAHEEFLKLKERGEVEGL